MFSIQAVYRTDFIAGQYAGIRRWHALRGRTMKNLRYHVCQFELDFNGRKLCAIKRKYALEVYNRFMHGSILPVTIPPGQPRGQVQPFGPGGGELFEAVMSRGEGGGANRK